MPIMRAISENAHRRPYLVSSEAMSFTGERVSLQFWRNSSMDMFSLLFSLLDQFAGFEECSHAQEDTWILGNMSICHSSRLVWERRLSMVHDCACNFVTMSNATKLKEKAAQWSLAMGAMLCSHPEWSCHYGGRHD